MENVKKRSFDVVIIGAGGAGLRAAIEAAQEGVSVAVVCKSLLGKAHTVMAEGGAAASLGNVDPEDNWQVHFGDTMRSAKFINNYRTAELFAKEAPDRILELESWGALFDRTEEGKIMQRPFGAHTYRRLAHVGDRTGLELIRTLQYKGIHTGIEVFQEVTSTTLFRDDQGAISGVLAYERESGVFLLLETKAVVLATGGWGKAYATTSNSWECTGDGAAMAYAAGAQLMDMEMVQFHPTGMVWPPGVRGILVTEGVRGEGGYLRNSNGDRFMLEYDPERKELSSRDIVARSIYKEVEAGRGTPHGGAWLDITHKGADFIRHKLPNMYDQFKTLADVDITKEPFEVAPTIHYTMGGLRVDPEACATNVPGLFAAGEVACGLHGANRLGGNSLSDLLVFGRRAGMGAKAFAQDRGAAHVSDAQVEEEMKRVLHPFSVEDGENPYVLHEELQAVMTRHAGIRREEGLLKEGLEKVLALQERAKRCGVSGSRMYNPGWHKIFEVQSMLTLCEAIYRCALLRKESRGAHWRQDWPDYDPALGRLNFIAQEVGGEMEISTSPVPQMPAELAAMFTEKDPGYHGVAPETETSGEER